MKAKKKDLKRIKMDKNDKSVEKEWEKKICKGLKKGKKMDKKVTLMVI